ncbi:hypothetical protein FisN_14Lh345 [Fistulifera solaris]|uniref:Uncharacterized protein n=1 Tax=Fistulifera solaris TaxID=1519565 RepID=A0A1Z5JI10_FISSO|nr:hypothetical protein FisN_14Lh345 [Fistulifera solaris]|eukprot:GAX13644.1 hypothetical protein FisN_14Lh345 [Fistulifera solaris]
MWRIVARQSLATQRFYHATARREILPLVGVATVFVLGRYSYKAWKRMDEEWEDYQWQLRQYEKQMLQNTEAETTTKTIAIDLGSIYTKLATNYPKPEVIATREGDRHFFNGIVYKDGVVEAQGRSAMEKFSYSPSSAVTLPWNVISSSSSDPEQAAKIVEDVLGLALDETLDRIGYNPESTSTALRSVVTVPAVYLRSDVYSAAFANVATTFLPEPVAAVWGAQWKSLLPTEEGRVGRTTLVVDVGGKSMALSMVQKDVVLSSITLPWGGERWIEIMVDLLRKESSEPLEDERSLTALQTHARMALAELSAKSRADIHVHYLFADPTKHHLDTSISRSVLEKAIKDDVKEYLVQAAQTESALSPHMPPPTDLSSLFTSSLTQLLEFSQKTPMNVDHILLLGGAARAPVIASSLGSALYALMGAEFSQKLVVPDNTLLPELTVLGASTMLPTYTYAIDEGLVRLPYP